MGRRKEAISLQPTGYYHRAWIEVEVSERSISPTYLHRLNSALQCLSSTNRPKIPLTIFPWSSPP